MHAVRITAKVLVRLNKLINYWYRVLSWVRQTFAFAPKFKYLKMRGTPRTLQKLYKNYFVSH